ncbi:MAG: hypothetical protein ABI229_06235 [Gemmatimonadaceae bacterium]
MTNDELHRRWESRRDDYARVGAHVDGALIVQEFLRDVDAVEGAFGQQLLRIRDAAEIGGYSVRHLGRLIKRGQIPNAGRPNAPLIRLRDLPLKTALPNAHNRCMLVGNKAQIARSVVHPKRSNDG